jgi:Mg-chelatase subunit ChlI
MRLRGHSPTDAREAALRRLTRVNRLLVAGSVALTAVLADIASQAFAGKAHHTPTAGSVRAGARRRHPTASPSAHRAKPTPPPAAPQASPERESSEGGESPSSEARETPSPEAATPEEASSSAPAEHVAEAAPEAPAETAPSSPPPPAPEAPVVSGGS